MRQAQLTLPFGSPFIAEACALLDTEGVEPTSLSGLRSGAPVVMLVFTLSTQTSGRIIERLAERGFGSLEVLELRAPTADSHAPVTVVGEICSSKFEPSPSCPCLL